MVVIGNGLEESGVIKDKQGNHPQLNQIVEPGNKYRLFFKIWKNKQQRWDGVAAAVPGRSGDYDVIGTGFIPLNEEEFSMDELGKLVDKSGLDEWARIAAVLHRARCTREKKSKEREMQSVAEEQGTPIDQVGLAKALDGIEEKYFGGKTANGDRIMPKVQPFLSRLQIKICTQCICVRLAADGTPEWEQAKVCTIDLSDKRKTQIQNAINTAGFRHEDEGFVEIAYDYLGQDKKTAGQNASFNGISDDLSLKKQYADSWEMYGKDMLGRLADTGMDVAVHAKSLQRNSSPQEIISNIKKWCSTNIGVVSAIDIEEERTKYAAKAILDNGLVDGAPKMRESLQKLVEDMEAERAAGKEDNGEVTISEAKAQEKAALEAEKENEELIADVTKQIMEKPVGTMSELQQITENVPSIDELGGGVEDL